MELENILKNRNDWFNDIFKIILSDSPSWARRNTKILAKLSGESDSVIEKTGQFYSKSHKFPLGWKNDPNLILPKRYNGIKYDEFGFPKLKEFSPGSHTFYKKILVGEPRSTDNLAALEWLKIESNLIDGTDFKQIGDGKGSILFKIDGKWEKCSWHHHQDGQTLIPVLFGQHNKIAGKHSGGVSILTNYPELIGVFK